MTVNVKSLLSGVRQLGAIAAVVIGALNTVSMPAEVRAVLVGVGGALITVEHLVSKFTASPTSQTTTTTTEVKP
jgi:hypothetical protein